MDEVAIPVVAIVAWAAITIFAMYQRSKRREMVHRERLAMIERGLVPPPETDPARFERVMNWHEEDDRRSGGRRAGLILIAVGLGLAMLISLASGETGVGIGVGGMLVLIGLALLISAVWDSGTRSMPPPIPPSPGEPREPR